MRQPEPDPELESQIRHCLSFLFTDQGAQLVSNQRLPGTGNSQVSIRTGDMILRVTQTEGSISVLAAPAHSPDSSQAIEYLLMAADPDCWFPPRPVYGSLAELSGLLEPRMLLLNDALSAKRFRLTIQDSRKAARKGFVMLTPRPLAHVPFGKRILRGWVKGIARIIQFLFRPSRRGWAEHLPIGNDAELEECVRQELGFLFRQHGAQVSSNGQLGIMDFASVAIDVGNARIRASRSRGLINLSIAPIFAVRYWHSLGVAFLAIRPDTEIPESIPSSILRGSGHRIEEVFTELNEAFSEAQYAVTNEKIREIEESLNKRWMEDWNQKANAFRAKIS